MLDVLKQYPLNLAQALTRVAPWTNIVGIARSILAISTAFTLLVNPTDFLFRQGAGMHTSVQCFGPAKTFSLFCLDPAVPMDTKRWFAILILAIVAIGWRPAITALGHWWVSTSVFMSASVVDGGEQVTALLTLLLLPLCITDFRNWHFATSVDRSPWRRATATSALLVIQIQVAFIYAQALIGKLSGQEWLDGTAMYYWLIHPFIGATGVFLKALAPILSTQLVIPVTWSVLLLEAALATALFWRPAARRKLLPVAVGFHCAIALLMGISSFAAAMIAALLLYLPEPGLQFKFSLHREGSFRIITREGLKAPIPSTRQHGIVEIL